jgi:hypothetical protein
MNENRKQIPHTLKLKVGDLVEVRYPAEILSTLDDRSALEGLPFMPEMLQFCGKRFRVYKRAHKACDTIAWSGLRRMKDAVHLESLRCDGQGHDACEAGCLLYWKEAWLKPANSECEPSSPPSEEELQRAYDQLSRLTQFSEKNAKGEDVIHYMCQATEMSRATSPLVSWDIRQFWEDWSCGNVSMKLMARSLLIWVFNKLQIIRRGAQYPYIEGKLEKTPSENIGLKPGELVRVKSKIDIMKTLNKRNRNRGLSFDREMVKYCGGTFRVLRQVGKIVNDQTGTMMRLPNDCMVLEGVICQGDLNKFCPRSILPYWREIWLERVPQDSKKTGPNPLPIWRQIWLDHAPGHSQDSSPEQDPR